MELYENKMGVHTFELNLRLSGFDEYRERAEQLYQEENDILSETGKGVWKSDGTIYDYRTCGIRLHLEKADFVWLKLVISPRNLIGDRNPFGVTEITLQTAQQLTKKIQAFLDERKFPYQVKQFQLSRIDLCTNLLFEDESMPATIIRLLNRTPPKGEYQRVSFSSAQTEHGMQAYEKNMHSYMIALQQESIKVYDKVYEIQKKRAVFKRSNRRRAAENRDYSQQRSNFKMDEKKCSEWRGWSRFGNIVFSCGTADHLPKTEKGIAVRNLSPEGRSKKETPKRRIFRQDLCGYVGDSKDVSPVQRSKVGSRSHLEVCCRCL